MRSSSDDDDDDGDDNQPDVIDLTAPESSYRFLDVLPLRPPSPFADSSSNGIVVVTSLPAVARKSSPWRRTVHRIFKRVKINQRKKSPFKEKSLSIPMELNRAYDFGATKVNRNDSVSSRTSRKRVHWVDDHDEIQLNLSHRFVEYLKLLVNAIVDQADESTIDQHLRLCQRAFERFDDVFDHAEIRLIFQRILHLVRTRDQHRLIEQQLYLEHLISEQISSSL